MFPLLFLVFVAVPILEIVLFIEIGGLIGTWPTIAGIILTAVIGTFLLRSQGSGLLARARATLARGEMPVEEVVHGLFLLLAGALLLTPGFFTDTVGFLLCIPAIRLALGRVILRRIRNGMSIHVSTFRAQPPPPPEPGHVNRHDAETGSGKPGGPSKWRPPEDDEGDR